MADQAIYYILTFGGVAVCLLAILKGGAPERFGAGLILGVSVVQRIVAALMDASSFLVIQLVGDAVTAVALLSIALGYTSLWVGAAMLLYASQFTLHSYYFVTNRPNDLFHVVVSNVNFLGVIFALAIGTGVSWRRRIVNRRAAGAPAQAATPTA